ncbi:hypothetical protein [Halorubrum distributum]|uniref:hypothetical protein n=1 Tax=Halorubrum distributum TaxID=29283 RepID=UPI0019394677|nr:hypothetical protein [Halorubrum terrestre]
MERRKFVVGLGALASGSAAAVGTGAFTPNISSRNRSMNINVVSDDAGILEFFARGAFTEITESGRAQINFGAAGGDGINVDSVVEFPGNGEYRGYDSPLNGDWFAIGNATGENFGGLYYEFEAGEDWQVSSSDTYVTLSAEGTASGSEYKEMTADDSLSPGDTVSMEVSGFPSGEEQQLGLKVSTVGASTEDDLSGSLTIETR